MFGYFYHPIHKRINQDVVRALQLLVQVQDTFFSAVLSPLPSCTADASGSIVAVLLDFL